MTAKQLFIEVEDKLREALAMCDMTATAASSDGFELNSDSVMRVMNIAILDLREVIEKCEAASGEQEND